MDNEVLAKKVNDFALKNDLLKSIIGISNNIVDSDGRFSFLKIKDNEYYLSSKIYNVITDCKNKLSYSMSFDYFLSSDELVKPRFNLISKVKSNEIILTRILEKYNLTFLMNVFVDLEVFIKNRCKEVDECLMQLSFDKNQNLSDINLIMKFKDNHKPTAFYTDSVFLFSEQISSKLNLINEYETFLHSRLAFLYNQYNDIYSITGCSDWFDLFEVYRKAPDEIESLIAISIL